MSDKLTAERKKYQADIAKFKNKQSKYENDLEETNRVANQKGKEIDKVRQEAHIREQQSRQQLAQKANEVDRLLAEAKEERQKARAAMNGWEQKAE